MEKLGKLQDNILQFYNKWTGAKHRMNRRTGYGTIQRIAKGTNGEGKNIRPVINPTEGGYNREKSKTGHVHTLLTKLIGQLIQDE